MDRDWIATFDTRVRRLILLKVERGVEKACRNLVASADKEDARRRARNRRELRKHDKEMRKQFRWRGASEGRTAYLTPQADGSFSASEMAKHEAEMLFAGQASGKANNGVEIVKRDTKTDKLLDAIEREEKLATMTVEDKENEALATLLQGDVAKFMRKKHGTNN